MCPVLALSPGLEPQTSDSSLFVHWQDGSNRSTSHSWWRAPGVSKYHCVDGGIRITGGSWGPTLRPSESGDLGQDSGIPWVKSSRRDSKAQPGPGATVDETRFAKSRHADGCSSSHPRPAFQLSVKGTPSFILCSDNEKKGGRREAEKQTTLIVLVGKRRNSLYSIPARENLQLLDRTSLAPGWLRPRRMQLLISGS